MTQNPTSKKSHRKIVSYGFIFLFIGLAAAIAATQHWYLAVPWLMCACYEWLIEKRSTTINILGKVIAGFLESDSRWMTSCPPGEMADKASILALKLRKLEGKLTEDRELWLKQQLETTLGCFHRSIAVLLPETENKQHRLDLLLDELTQINEEQWNWEDRVRSEQSPTKGWEAASGARQCNTRRVQCKNAINRLCGIGEEEKSYASKD